MPEQERRTPESVVPEELAPEPEGPEAGEAVGDEAVERERPEAAARDDEATAEGEDLETTEREQPDDAADEERDLLDDLQRLQADFSNYKKRMLREQTDIASRASRSLIERLLPVLDNFELAIAHGETGGGVDLVFKELMAVLQSEGLEPLESDGKPFDPTVHEAVEMHEDDSVDEQTVTRTYRRGYALKGRLIRPAMVGVARPTQNAEAVGE